MARSWHALLAKISVLTFYHMDLISLPDETLESELNPRGGRGP